MRPVYRRIVSSVALSLMLCNGLPSVVWAKSSPWDAHILAGKQQMAAGDYAEAAVSLEDALKDTARFPENDPRMGDTYYNLGELRLRQQEWAQAKQYYERALFMQQKTLDPESLAIGDTLYGLATACEQVGNHQMAVILLKRVKDIWSHKYGAKDARLTQVLPSMATYATLASDYKTAQDCYRQLVSIQEQTLGANSPRLASSMNLLAAALANTGNYSEAEPFAQRAVNILASAGGNSNSIGLDSAGMNLTYIQQQLGKSPTYTDHTNYNDVPVAIPVTSIAKTVAPVPVERKQPPVAAKIIVEHKPLAVTPPVVVHTVVDVPIVVKTVEAKISAKTAEVKPIVAAPKPVETKVAIAPLATNVLVHQSDLQTPAKRIEPTAAAAPAVVAAVPKVVAPAVALPVAETKAPTVVAAKPVQIAALPDMPSKIPTEAKLVMRPPTTAIVTTSDDFHPWELANATQSGQGKHSQNTNFGKIRFLANGRLISQEEYKAMLLANEAYEFIRSEKYTMAVEVLHRALAIYPDLASGHTNLGLAYSQLGDKTQAIQELKQAIAIDPSRSAPWLNLASAFQVSGDLKASVATYSEYMKRFSNDPNMPKARDVLAHLDRELKEQTDVERALAIHGGSKNDYFAYASHTGAARWPADRTNIKVFVAAGDVPGFKPEYAGFFADSFKQWSLASGNKFCFEFVKNAGTADIECLWTDDTAKVSSPEEGGETKVVRGGGKIDHATITVLTTGMSADSPLSASQIRAVCLHEIGHALGICGHSPAPDDVMYCSIPGAHTKVGISARDTATIQRLYSSDTVVGWLQ